MEKKHRRYLKLNLMSLFFVAVSFISVTLAWFAYSGFASSKIDVDIKAWHIEFNGESKASNEIVIPLTNIYPGMDTIVESVNIKNKGDSEAKLSYIIESVRILDEELEISSDQNIIVDKLSNDYPFNIDISLSKQYLNANTGEATINLSVSWPLDSDTDSWDSEWGNKTYEFQQNELLLEESDPNYNARTSIKVVISLIAEQNIDKYTYNTGNMVLYNPVEDKVCDTIGGNCYKTNIITPNTDNGDSVYLLPNILNNYGSSTYDNRLSILSNATSSWVTSNGPLELKQIVNLVATDVHDTYLVREGLSDSLVGFVGLESRFDNYISNKVIGCNNQYNGYIKFDSVLFDYLDTNKCYWINYEYDDTRAFTLSKLSDGVMKIGPMEKTTSCYVVPVIEVSKEKLYK